MRDITIKIINFKNLNKIDKVIHVIIIYNNILKYSTLKK